MAMFRWAEFDPFSGLRAVQRELERLTNRGGLSGARGIGGGSYPPVNVLNGPSDILVQCEMAGVQRGDLDLSITGQTLIVKGTKAPSADEAEVRFQRRERGSGDFSRTVVLPDKVDPDAVTATMKAGVLTIRLPKASEAMPKHIEVK